MKTRLGFVSNSSSSSFIVPATYFSDEGYALAEKTADRNCWSIQYERIGGEVFGVVFETSMDNFDMKEYLFDMGIPYDVMEDL